MNAYHLDAFNNDLTGRTLLAAIEEAQLQPVIDRIFPFSQAIDGYRHLDARRHFGKVVIAFDCESGRGVSTSQRR